MEPPFRLLAPETLVGLSEHCYLSQLTRLVFEHSQQHREANTCGIYISNQKVHETQQPPIHFSSVEESEVPETKWVCYCGRGIRIQR